MESPTLTLTYSVEFDPSKSTYLTYSLELYPSELSYPSMIRLSSDSSASSATGQAPPPIRGCGFIHTRAVTRECEQAWDGEHGDNTPGGFRNGYLSFDC